MSYFGLWFTEWVGLVSRTPVLQYFYQSQRDRGPNFNNDYRTEFYWNIETLC